MPDDLAHLRQEAYRARLEVEALRRAIFGRSDPSTAPDDLFDQLETAEQAYAEAESRRLAAEPQDPQAGLIMRAKKDAPGTLGGGTTGLEAAVHLRLAYLPTAICHLLDSEHSPLLSATVKNVSDSKWRRVRVTSYVQGYSAKVVESAEIKQQQEIEFKQLPTFYPRKLADVKELTRATLNVLIEDLDGKVELHRTHPIWLLARNSAPLKVKDPRTGSVQDLTHYLGAFVTPNAPSLLTFLRLAAAAHPSGRLIGYQGNPTMIEPQVEAIFNALKNADITYVNSLVDFNPDLATASQRVRLPRESLKDKEANCIDGTVLLASLLEGISLNPALVLVPGHAFLAWETWKDSGQWRYLETTMIGSEPFAEARSSGEEQARRFQALAQKFASDRYFRRLSLKDLRAAKGITPME